MLEPSLFQIFTAPLNKLAIPYMVTGAVASIIYGEPRLTHDLDLVVKIKPDDAEALIAVFPPRDFYCPPVEVIRLEAKRPLRGHFSLIHLQTGFKADLYTLGDDRLHHWAMAHRKMVQIAGEPFWLASVEYVILRKLEYYREGGSQKHLIDIVGILMVSSEDIDFGQLDTWVQGLNLHKEWDIARAQAQ